MDASFSSKWIYPYGDPPQTIDQDSPDLFDFLRGGAKYARKKGLIGPKCKCKVCQSLEHGDFKIRDPKLKVKVQKARARLIGELNYNQYLYAPVRPHSKAETQVLTGLANAIPTFDEQISRKVDAVQQINVVYKDYGVDESQPVTGKWISDRVSEISTVDFRSSSDVSDVVTKLDDDPVIDAVYNLEHFFKSCVVKVKNEPMRIEHAGYSFRWLFSRKFERLQRRKRLLDARAQLRSQQHGFTQYGSVDLAIVTGKNWLDIEVDGYSLRKSALLPKELRYMYALIRRRHPQIVEFEYKIGLHLMGAAYIDKLDIYMKEYLSWLRLTSLPTLAYSCLTTLVHHVVNTV